MPRSRVVRRLLAITAASASLAIPFAAQHSAAAAASTPLTGTAGYPYPYPVGSPYRTAIPANVALDADSANIGAEVSRQAHLPAAATFNVGPDYAPPVYVANASSVRVDVKVSSSCYNNWGTNSGAPLANDQFRQVPMPSGAAPASNSDAEMVIWDTASDTMWNFWQAKHNSDGSWEACWGGRLSHASATGGLFPYPYGTTAVGSEFLTG